MKRMLSVLLTLCMLLSAMPVGLSEEIANVEDMPMEEVLIDTPEEAPDASAPEEPAGEVSIVYARLKEEAVAGGVVLPEGSIVAVLEADGAFSRVAAILGTGTVVGVVGANALEAVELTEAMRDAAEVRVVEGREIALVVNDVPAPAEAPSEEEVEAAEEIPALPASDEVFEELVPVLPVAEAPAETDDAPASEVLTSRGPTLITNTGFEAISIGVGEVVPVMHMVTYSEDINDLRLFTASKTYFDHNGRKSGVIQALSVGKGKLVVYVPLEPDPGTYKNQGELATTIDVTVKELAQSATLLTNAVYLDLNTSPTFTMKYVTPANTALYNVVWSSSDPNVFAVDDFGNITATGVGEATLTLQAAEGTPSEAYAAATVTVTGTPTAVHFMDAALGIPLGEKASTGAYTEPVGADRNLKYTLSAPGIISISKDTITALKEGSVNVTVTDSQGHTDTCTVTVYPKPSSIEILEDPIILAVGETMTVTAKVDTDGWYASKITWKTSSTQYATVDAFGTITAKRVGSTTLTAKTFNGKSCTRKITVVKQPTGLSFVPNAVSIGVGESRKVQPTFSPSGSRANTLSWVSDAPVYATVDGAGNIVGVAPGVANITATFNDTVAGVLKVTVTAPPTGISFTELSVTIGSGQTHKMEAVVVGGGAEPSFESDDKSVASIDKNGLITGTGVGTTVVRAKTYNGLECTATVNVHPAPNAVSVSPGGTTAADVGESVFYTAVDSNGNNDATWKSSNTKVAFAYPSGEVIALQPGTATITATTYNGKKATAKISVRKLPASVSLSRSSVDMGIGETTQLFPVFPKNTGSAIYWETSDENVVTVLDGSITAVNMGQATITATTANTKVATCTVTVKAEPTAISAPTSYNMCLGQTASHLATIPDPSEGGTLTYNYTFNDNGIVRLNEDGSFTAMNVGIASLTASTYNGLTKVVQVSVLDKPKSIAIIPPLTTTYLAGETGTLSAYTDATTTEPAFTWTSSSPTVVSIDENGNFKALKKGSATITAKTFNGKVARVKLTVKAAPTSLTLSQTELKLGKGESAVVDYTVTKKTFTTVSWSIVSGAGIVSLMPDGTVTGLNPGTAVIRATTLNGLYEDCTVEVYPAPTYIAADAATVNIGLKSTVSSIAHPEPGTWCQMAYEAIDPSIVRVNADGSLTGLKLGSTLIIAKAPNFGSVANEYVSVMVVAAPTTVYLDRTSLELSVGQVETLSAHDNQGINSFTWTTSNKAVATVDQNGKVTALKAGSANITAKSYNGKTKVCKVRVYASPTSIDVGIDDSIKVYVGSTLPIQIAVRPYKLGDITMTCIPAGAVTFDAAASTITCNTAGLITMTFTTFNGISTTAKLKVYEIATALSFNTAYSEMGVGESSTLSLTYDGDNAKYYVPVLWQSTDSTVVTNENGRLRALTVGTATVTATSTLDSSVKASCVVTVKKAPTYIELWNDVGTSKCDSVKYMDAGVAETYTFTTKMNSDAASAVALTSSDNKVVSVDGMTITAESEGVSVITAETFNGKRSTITVKVSDTKKPSYLALDNPPTGPLLPGGPDYALSWHSEPSGTDLGKLTWTSTNPLVASVDASGAITPLSGGSTTIVVTSSRNPDCVASCFITVQSGAVASTIPATFTTTDIADIAANQNAIIKLRDSALVAIQELEVSGIISASEASTRLGYIDRAFEDYTFMWITPAQQAYWTTANNEDKHLDYEVDKVYYGLPYTGVSGAAKFNAASAKSGNKYINTGKPYDVLNRSALVSNSACGSNAASFVSMATGGGVLTLSSLMTSKLYFTVSEIESVRPGDIIAKKSTHAMLVLYELPDSKLMVLENGSLTDPNVNTVHAAIYTISELKSNGYSVRRRTGLASY